MVFINNLLRNSTGKANYFQLSRLVLSFFLSLSLSPSAVGRAMAAEGRPGFLEHSHETDDRLLSHYAYYKGCAATCHAGGPGSIPGPGQTYN
jgi:hypothetical protein